MASGGSVGRTIARTKMNSRPTGITADKSHQLLKLTWNDGTQSAIAFQTLVDACPCEMCVTERNDPNPLKILRPKSTVLEAIVPVGNYGISILWNGGCRYGIFTWDYLRKIADPRPKPNAAKK